MAFAIGAAVQYLSRILLTFEYEKRMRKYGAAWAGVFLVFFLHNAELTIFAMMGAIGLAGVVVNGAIVMVDAIHRRLQGDWEAESSQEIVIEAVTSRLRPIIVTTLTTLGGVLPMAYGLGGYDVFVAPMSMTIGWGMVFSTLVTLFLVPVLYAIARDLRSRFE